MAPHSLDDARRVVDEDFGIVGAAVVVQRGRCGGDCNVELRGVDSDAVSRADFRVAVPLERGPWMDQCEIDVEEDRPGRHHFGGTGVATATDARSGCSTLAAAALTSSSVTARSSDGN